MLKEKKKIISHRSGASKSADNAMLFSETIRVSLDKVQSEKILETGDQCRLRVTGHILYTPLHLGYPSRRMARGTLN